MRRQLRAIRDASASNRARNFGRDARILSASRRHGAASGMAACLRAVPASRAIYRPSRATVSRSRRRRIYKFAERRSYAARLENSANFTAAFHFVFVATPAFGRPPYLVNNRLANCVSRTASPPSANLLSPPPPPTPVTNPVTPTPPRGRRPEHSVDDVIKSRRSFLNTFSFFYQLSLFCD